MKKLMLSLMTLLILASCGGDKTNSDFNIKTASLEELRTEKESIIKSYDSIGDILGKLDIAISEKDTLKRLPLVTSFQVKDTLFKHFIDIQGSVTTDQNVLIYPEYQGMLTRVYIQEGQRVSKGQLLATIDDGGLSSQVAQMETQYQLAKTTYERQERLWNQKIGSEIQYLQAKASMESTQSAVNQMKAQLARTAIRAPFSGEIDEIITKQGQIVAPGAVALMRIVNLNNMYVEASIPENYLGSIDKGADVIISIPSMNKQMPGTIKSIGNYIEPGNRTFDIEVNLPRKEKGIKPNLITKLEINNYTKENAKVIPSNVIQENAKGEKYVFIISEDESKTVVTRKLIETGMKYQGFIEVLNGLDGGETIVAEGALTLKDGAEINVKATK